VKAVSLESSTIENVELSWVGFYRVRVIWLEAPTEQLLKSKLLADTDSAIFARKAWDILKYLK
jgi:hypothetical protein